MNVAAGRLAEPTSTERPDTSARIHLPDFIPQFDGLRAIAILAVMLTHSSALRALGLGPFVEHGRLGVDLFFVLSGFLITGILLDSTNSRHYFRNFYARRALRIWPLYYVVVLVVAVSLPAASRSEFFRSQVTHWPYVLFYLQNCIPGYALPLMLSPTWSLAVEEQFYLVWPTIVKFVRGSMLPKLLILLALAALVVRVLLFRAGLPMEFVHHFTFARLEPLVLGSLAAWWIRSPNITLTTWRRGSLIAMIAGCGGVLVTRLLWTNQSSIISYIFISMLFTGVLGLSTISRPGSLLYRLLCIRWLRYIGKISYGLYLIHIPVDLTLQAALLEFGKSGALSRSTLVFSGIASLLLAISVESLIWRYFEAPLLRLKRYFPAQPPVVEATIASGIAR